MTEPVVIVEPSPDTPLVWFDIAICGGAATDPRGVEGLHRHAALLARRGAGTRARAELAQFAERPPNKAEVEKAKAIAETDFWTSLVDLDGKAEALGHYETALGDFRKVNAIAERLAAVTADDVARVVRGYLRPERRTIVIAQPEGGEDEDE